MIKFDKQIPMTLQDELITFYKKHGFGEVVGSRLTVPVYTGCILVPLPNIETRRRYLKYHDLHHIITGYSVGRIGEGEMSAWELGTGSIFISPMLGFMNLIALSTGIFLEPKRMWQAFKRGCKSRNLYPTKSRADIDSDRWPNIETLEKDILEIKQSAIPIAIRAMEFAGYSAAALIIHATIAIPAAITRLITDITLGYTIFQAVKPKKRTDIF